MFLHIFKSANIKQETQFLPQGVILEAVEYVEIWTGQGGFIVGCQRR